MSHANGLISFLRHYGPIAASDNMYDELIQFEIDHYKIESPIHIKPSKFEVLKSNFDSPYPRNVILTGTAGDGKTYHCRLIWEYFGGDLESWQRGEKRVSFKLPSSSKTLVIVKDLSELTQKEKDSLLPDFERAVSVENSQSVFLIAANDGQLLATWRDWVENQKSSDQAREMFMEVEGMLVEGRTQSEKFNLDMYNLSSIDASAHFEELVKQIVEHPQWEMCQGCELLKGNGTTTCPIRINRERLQGGAENSTFRKRLGDLLKLARANRMHLPIRDLLLLGVNIILGDQKDAQILLDCATAKTRVARDGYRLTNPYANVFGLNLPDRQRQQYQVFTVLEAFGIGRETDNKFDNLLIYEAYKNSDLYRDLVAKDDWYGESSYRPFLHDYLEGDRENIDEFMHALACQRQRLFFSISDSGRIDLDPWLLTVYRSSGDFLKFIKGLKNRTDVSRIEETLVKGLNRTFCGMMIDESTELHLASSGGDGRGRIAFLLDDSLRVNENIRYPYIRFELAEDHSLPCLLIIDPVVNAVVPVEKLNLPLTHFEYLVRVAGGSLPSSFSRQCYEDFLDFKLRVMKRLNLAGSDSSGEIILRTLAVDERGRVQTDKIRIVIGDMGK